MGAAYFWGTIFAVTERMSWEMKAIGDFWVFRLRCVEGHVARDWMKVDDWDGCYAPNCISISTWSLYFVHTERNTISTNLANRVLCIFCSRIRFFFSFFFNSSVPFTYGHTHTLYPESILFHTIKFTHRLNCSWA